MDYKEYARQLRENAVKDEYGRIICSAELWEQIASIIEKSEEVKHGKWKIKTDDYDCEYMKCSCCKEEFYPVDEDTVDTTPKYCMNCGAKMDGKEEKYGIKKQDN